MCLRQVERITRRWIIAGSRRRLNRGCPTPTAWGAHDHRLLLGYHYCAIGAEHIERLQRRLMRRSANRWFRRTGRLVERHAPANARAGGDLLRLKADIAPSKRPRPGRL